MTPPPLRTNLSHHAITINGGTASRNSQLLALLVGVSTEKREVNGFREGYDPKRGSPSEVSRLNAVEIRCMVCHESVR
eukprot:3808413-Rhodomonas_salina.2